MFNTCNKPRACFSSYGREIFYCKVKLQNTICGNPPSLFLFILLSTPTTADRQTEPPTFENRKKKKNNTKTGYEVRRVFHLGSQAAT